MPHDNFSPSFKDSCKTNKLSETFRGGNSLFAAIRRSLSSLILICSLVRQANHRYGLVANPVVLVELGDLRGLFQLKLFWFFDLQIPGKVSLEHHVPNLVAMQISSWKHNHSPPRPDGLRVSASRCTQDQQDWDGSKDDDPGPWHAVCHICHPLPWKKQDMSLLLVHCLLLMIILVWANCLQICSHPTIAL